jgi:dethiobiotin synthase
VLRGVFVTGTDTNVGKTAVAAALLVRYRRQLSIRYWKPIQTGIERDDDSAEVTRLARADSAEILNCGVRLRHPVSPHLAARLNGSAIELRPILDVIAREPSPATWIVEGAGGILVPVNDAQTIADLMLQLGLPALVVARTSLGTINHTLLTLEALRRRAIAIAGIVMVGDPNRDNRDAIEQYGGAPVVGEMPLFTPFTPEHLIRWAERDFDPAGRLMDVLR